MEKEFDGMVAYFIKHPLRVIGTLLGLVIVVTFLGSGIQGIWIH